ncbi:hypothetical protein E6P97_03420 [Patescibacteria group bacterium]|nr:MAG: hypothetical protein E6P97_03420 [Patescibacteria group bacterium]
MRTAPAIAPSAPPLHEVARQRPSFGELVSSLEDELVRCSTAWRTLTQIKREALDSTNLTQVSQLNMVHEKVEADANRHDRRGQGGINDFVRRNTEIVQGSISLGQGAASWVRYGTDAEQATASANIAAAREEHDAYIAGSLVEAPINHYAGKVYLDVFDAYSAALEADDALLEPIHRWISESPNGIATAIEWMQSEEAELDGEHLPLAQALARLQGDPLINSVVDRILDEIKSDPGLLRTAFAATFCGDYDGAQEEDPELYATEPSIAILRFMPKLLQSIGIELSTNDLVRALSAIPTAEWPITLQAQLEEQHEASVDHIKATYKALLEPYYRPDRYLQFKPPETRAIGTEPNRPKKKKARSSKGSGRATPKSRGAITQTSSELESAHQITDAFTIADAPNGQVLVQIPVDPRPDNPTDLLMNAGRIKAYLEKYSSDPRIAADVKRMVESIVQQPRGAGAIKLIGSSVSLVHPGKSVRKPTSIWELSPKKRAELHDLGQIGTDTRLFYAVIPNGDGTESIGLLKINHKNVTTKLNRGANH